MTARLVALEGGEGSGKSTQARLLAERLDAVLTREPGGTRLGEEIRRLVLEGTDDVHPRTEALLMAAARAQHVAEVIRPALESGRHVVTDRFTPSSLAYQGFGRGLDGAEIGDLSRWATGGLSADLVVLLDVPDDIRRARTGKPRDRLEAAGDEFHERVIAGFRQMAARFEGSWEVVDGSGDVDTVAELVWQAWLRSERRLSA
ncbi:MAG TPA: dTMP kinase [Acidimicrobiales bacterium]|nr:dTMP kinase [Acidimicrobiales bacterium]